MHNIVTVKWVNVWGNTNMLSVIMNSKQRYYIRHGGVAVLFPGFATR